MSRKLFLLAAFIIPAVVIIDIASARTINYLDYTFDQFGCNQAAGYQWCPYSERCLRPTEQICQGVAFGNRQNFQRPSPQLRDLNGCITSDGQRWCASMNKCITPWIESCKPEFPAGSFNYSFVYGLNVTDCWSLTDGSRICRTRARCTHNCNNLSCN